MSEASIRLVVFLGLVIVLLSAERILVAQLQKRWQTTFANFLLATMGAVLLKLVPFVSALSIAYWCASHQWGLLYYLPLPSVVLVALAFIILDIAVYWQHRWMHEIPVLWRLHKVHHSDLDVDVSTGVRFHPLEILLSQGWKLAVVFIIGAPVLAVMAFELVLGVCSLIIHTKLSLPPSLDRLLIHFVVTPAMHRVHHHRDLPDTNRNYATIFSCWDRLFGSFSAPKDAASIVYGLRAYPKTLSCIHLLALPFKPTDSQSTGKHKRD